MFSDINYNPGWGVGGSGVRKKKKSKFLIDIPAHSKRRILVFTVQEGGEKNSSYIFHTSRKESNL